MERKLTIIAGVGSLLMLLLVILSYQVFSTKKVEVLEVLVAKETIYPRTKITEYNTKVVKVPKIYITGNALTDKKMVLGHYTNVYSVIPEGSLFYQEILEKPENLSDYPGLLLLKGQVSYALMSDVAKSAGNSLVAGQKVDLYASISQKEQAQVTDCLIKGIRITAIKDRNGVDITKEESSGIPYVILLAVNESYVKYLKAADKLGNIELYAVNANYGDMTESQLNENSLVLPYLLA